MNQSLVQYIVEHREQMHFVEEDEDDEDDLQYMVDNPDDSRNGAK